MEQHPRYENILNKVYTLMLEANSCINEREEAYNEEQEQEKTDLLKTPYDSNYIGRLELMRWFYLQQAIISISTAEAIYYSNVEHIADARLEDIFNAFQEVKGEVLLYESLRDDSMQLGNYIPDFKNALKELFPNLDNQ